MKRNVFQTIEAILMAAEEHVTKKEIIERAKINYERFENYRKSLTNPRIKLNKILKKRSRPFIVIDILKSAEGGIIKTQIMYRANLSHDLLNKYLDFLIEGRYLKKREIIYEPTKKGLDLLKAYRNFEKDMSGRGKLLISRYKGDEEIYRVGKRGKLFLEAYKELKRAGFEELEEPNDPSDNRSSLSLYKTGFF